MATSIDKFETSAHINCEVCIKGKAHKKAISTASAEATKPLELVHTDVCGSMDTPSIGGSRYFVTFIDDNTRKS